MNLINSADSDPRCCSCLIAAPEPINRQFLDNDRTDGFYCVFNRDLGNGGNDFRTKGRIDDLDVFQSFFFPREREREREVGNIQRGGF